jgi:peptide/nickel transport system permease protein
MIRKYIIKNKKGVFGISVLFLFGLIAVLAPYLATRNPWESFKPNLGISKEHLLGTDLLGRDVFSQLIWGSRISLLVGVGSAAGILIFGSLVGLASALSSPFMDEILMRFTDIILYIPKLPLLIFLAMMLGRGFLNVVLVMIFTMWPQTARIIRSEVLSLKQRPFVEAVKVLGVGTFGLVKILIPHILPLLLASLTNLTIWAVVYEASLSFLGLGDPSVITWGTMLYYAHVSGVIFIGNYIPIIAPGLCITIFGVGMHYLASAIQDVYAQRTRLWKPF